MSGCIGAGVGQNECLQNQLFTEYPSPFPAYNRIIFCHPGRAQNNVRLLHPGRSGSQAIRKIACSAARPGRGHCSPRRLLGYSAGRLRADWPAILVGDLDFKVSLFPGGRGQSDWRGHGGRALWFHKGSVYKWGSNPPITRGSLY